MPHKRKSHSARRNDKESAGTDWAPKGSQDIRFEGIPKGKLNILNAKKIREDYHDRRRRQDEEQNKKRLPAFPTADEGPAQKKAKKRGAADADLDDSSVVGPTTAGGEEEHHEGVDPSKLKIRPGESLRDFNRRVETAYKFEISRAVHKVARSGRGEKRKARAQKLREQAQKEDDKFSRVGEKRKANAQAAEKREKAEQQELRAQRDAMRKEERDFETAPQRRGVREVADAPPNLKLGKLAGMAKKQKVSDPRQRELEQERERAVQAYRMNKERDLLKKMG